METLHISKTLLSSQLFETETQKGERKTDKLTPTTGYQPVWGLIRILPGGMPAASKGSKKKLPLEDATCPLMPPSKERELLVLIVG